MTARLCIIIPLGFFFCISLAIPAPIPSDAAKSEIYFPTQVGAKWVYQKGKREITKTVTAVENKKDGVHVTVGRVSSSGNVTPLEIICVSNKGLVQSRFKPADTDKPVILLKLPFKANEEWKYEMPGDGFLATVKENGIMKLFEVEEVKVPAGTFTAVRVVSEAFVLNGNICMKPPPTTFWYAPGVGLVKMIDNEQKVTVLKSFVPGK